MTVARAAPAVGIDLGTTFSVVAHVDAQGRPATLVNAEGELTTPSVVLLDGSEVIVGREAVKAMAVDSPKIADYVKRELGAPLYHKTLDGRRFPPEVLQAYILRKLADDARRFVGDFRQVVITVPAYFDEVRRKATQDAGYMAGLEVLDIINEPTAAAVAFGYREGFLDASGASLQPQNIIVYDLGGGTFDVTVMRIEGRDFRTLSTDGDSQLGGFDWDQRLVDLVAEEFALANGIDPRGTPHSLARIRRDCEEAKRTLSARAKAMVSCEYLGVSTRVEVTREQFEERTADLVDRTRFTTRQALQAAGLEWSQVARVLLVGGSTRMPMVRQMLTQLAGKEPDATVSADEVVAHGAALHASRLLAQAAGKPIPFHIQNVNSHSLGVVGIDRQTGMRRVAHLIPRNTPLPVRKERIFKTHAANQDSVKVQIVEGESKQPENCLPLGQCVIRDLPPGLPANSPVAVRFEYGTDGRLAVSVALPGTQHRAKQDLQRENSLSQSTLDEWRKKIAGR